MLLAEYLPQQTKYYYYESFDWFFVGYIFSFTSVGIRIIAIIADKRFVGIGDMEADTVKEFDDGEDFEIAFFSGMHR